MDKLFKLNKLGFRLKIFKRDSKFVITATSQDKIIEVSCDTLDEAIEECYDKYLKEYSYLLKIFK